MHYALCIMHFHIVIFYIKRRAASLSSSPSPPPCCIRLRSPLLLLVIFIFAPLLSPLFLQPSPPPSPWAILIVSSASPSMPSQPNHKPCHQHPIVSMLMAHSDETMRMTGHCARAPHTHAHTHARAHARTPIQGYRRRLVAAAAGPCHGRAAARRSRPRSKSAGGACVRVFVWS